MMLRFKCNLCSNKIDKLFYRNQDASKNQEIPAFLPCQCGGVMEKELPDFSTTSLEVVDNGAMIKKVELRRDAVAKAKEKGDRYIQTMNERERIEKKDEGNS